MNRDQKAEYVQQLSERLQSTPLVVLTDYRGTNVAEIDAFRRALEARGVSFTHVTLHVGAGTFLPVKVEDVTTHKMHAEWGQVSEAAAEEMRATKAAGGR